MARHRFTFGRLTRGCRCVCVCVCVAAAAVVVRRVFRRVHTVAAAALADPAVAAAVVRQLQHSGAAAVAAAAAAAASSSSSVRRRLPVYSPLWLRVDRPLWLRARHRRSHLSVSLSYRPAQRRRSRPHQNTHAHADRPMRLDVSGRCLLEAQECPGSIAVRSL